MRDNRILKAITMISQISISMMVPIFLCVFIGYQLDKKFQTGYWVLIFMILGFLTSIRNVYYLTKSFYEKDKAREDAEMNYFANLRQNNEELTMGKKHPRIDTSPKKVKSRKG